MGQRSSIDRLTPALRKVVDDAVADGATIDEIVDAVRVAGGEVSRSAMGRYRHNYGRLAERQRELASVARAMSREFGEADNMQGRMMVQLLTSIITRAVIPLAEGEAVDIGGQELHFLARAAKDAMSASKIDVDREVKIRDEAAKQARKAAVEAASTALKSGGATDESIELVRRRILGLSS